MPSLLSLSTSLTSSFPFFHSSSLLLQLRQLKNPPNSLLHVQITLRLTEKKGQTHTQREKTMSIFYSNWPNTHTVEVRVGKGGKEVDHNHCRPVFIFIGQHSFQLRLLTLAHTLNTCHELAKKENRGATAK